MNAISAIDTGLPEGFADRLALFADWTGAAPFPPERVLVLVDGEAVFLIRDRLIPATDWDISTRDGTPRAYRLGIPEAGGGRGAALPHRLRHRDPVGGICPPAACPRAAVARAGNLSARRVPRCASDLGRRTWCISDDEVLAISSGQGGGGYMTGFAALAVPEMGPLMTTGVISRIGLSAHMPAI